MRSLFRIAIALALTACCAEAAQPARHAGYQAPAPAYGYPPGYEYYREPPPTPYGASPYYNHSPYAGSPLYRATNPGSALAKPCEEGCEGHRCDTRTGRCVYPCRSNSDCELGYSCEVMGQRQAAICIWP